MSKMGDAPPQAQNEAAAELQAKFNQGMALHQQGKLEEAERIYGEVLRQQPTHFDALHLLGVIAFQTRRTERSVELISKAIGLNANVAAAHSNLGNALMDLKRLTEALASYDQAIALKPDSAEAYYNRGIALRDLKRLEGALASYDKAIALKSDYAEAYNNRGNALADLKQPEEALASCGRAIALKPNFAEAYYNRGNALTDLKQPEEALASYDRAITLKPDFAEAYYNRGNALRDLNYPADALASYDQAITLKPDYAEIYKNRGIALRDLKRPEDALVSYDRAISLKCDLAEVEGLRLHTKMHLCDWSNFDTECVHLISAVRNGNVNTTPFIFMTMPSSSDDQLRCAKLWIANKHLPSGEPIWQGERYDHDRIRIAYLSADFRQHPVGYLTAGLFEQHDRSQFEIIGVSFGIDDRSEIRKRIVTAFDEFHDVRIKNDKEIAKLLYNRQVDIAIDLMGHTRDSRLGIFAYRPAPIQVNFLGYPSTMGAKFIDYIIADKIVAPLEYQQFYTEKIVHLPDCWWVTDLKLKIAESAPTRREVGLPEHGFVFCCFNNSYKITPQIFDAWMRLLHQVKGSVLWLSQANNSAIRNLCREANARGIDASRLIFAQRLEGLDDHLARHRLADLFLDTLPYNAITTASDALWAGLPVLTCRGETSAGRVAASLLNAIHLPGLITTTQEEYEHLAIELATNLEKLARIKRKLADNRLTTPLFDTKLFTKHIEAAYTAMYKRHKAGLAPDHIIIPN